MNARCYAGLGKNTDHLGTEPELNSQLRLAVYRGR